MCYLLVKTENIYVYLKHIFKLGDYVECKKWSAVIKSFELYIYLYIYIYIHLYIHQWFNISYACMSDNYVIGIFDYLESHDMVEWDIYDWERSIVIYAGACLYGHIMYFMCM